MCVCVCACVCVCVCVCVDFPGGLTVKNLPAIQEVQEIWV